MTIEKTVADIPDSDLVERAVRSAIHNGKPKREYAWVKVMNAFGLGSTYSAQLCWRFDINPYVTGDKP